MEGLSRNVSVSVFWCPNYSHISALKTLKKVAQLSPLQCELSSIPEKVHHSHNPKGLLPFHAAAQSDGYFFPSHFLIIALKYHSLAV